MRLSARQKRDMPLLCDPKPPFVDSNDVDVRQAASTAKLRAALTRYETAHGLDALISLMKIELLKRGEQRWRLDGAAPKPGRGGQSSLLDAGR